MSKIGLKFELFLGKKFKIFIILIYFIEKKCCKLKVYSLAIEKSDKSDMPSLYNYYIGRSEANLKLNKYQEALNDAQEAINLNKNDSRAYLRKGSVIFVSLCCCCCVCIKLENFLLQKGALQS